jgi:hypothetical protein
MNTVRFAPRRNEVNGTESSKRFATVEDVGRLIDIMCELKTYGGPTGQMVDPRTAKELQKLKDELYSER